MTGHRLFARVALAAITAAGLTVTGGVLLGRAVRNAADALDEMRHALCGPTCPCNEGEQ